MTKTITANFAARTEKGQTKTFSTPAYDSVFALDETGRWSIPEYDEFVSEADVIDACLSATNWAAIRSEHFPMFGFGS